LLLKDFKFFLGNNALSSFSISEDPIHHYTDSSACMALPHLLHCSLSEWRTDCRHHTHCFLGMES
jgi:hypothetical protein